MHAYTIEELKAGMAHRFTRTITEAMMKQFAELSGDVSPLHTDDAFAREQGYPGKLAHGLLVGSFLSELAGLYLPGKYALSQGVDMHFHHPVFANDTLTITGEITSVHSLLRYIETKATIVNQDNITVVRGTLRTGMLPPK